MGQGVQGVENGGSGGEGASNGHTSEQYYNCMYINQHQETWEQLDTLVHERLATNCKGTIDILGCKTTKKRQYRRFVSF